MTRVTGGGLAPAATTRAPAKLNLTLAVTARRADGYHTLRSIFLRLALHDQLEVWPGEPEGDQDRLEVLGDEATPVEGNLVLRAAAELRRVVTEPLAPLRFRLTKRIPAAAGLAGGSSDGVAALDLAARAWGLRLDRATRLEVALRLGADAPFFAAGYAAALIGGIGEQLEPLPAPSPPLGVLLVTPPERLATARVFAQLDRWRDRDEPLAAGADPGASRSASQAADLVIAALREGPDGAGLAPLGPALRDANDLWAPAATLSRALVRQRGVLEGLLDRPVLLTGSGPTLFALYPSAGDAVDAGERLRQASPEAIEGAVVNATRTSDEGDSP